MGMPSMADGAEQQWRIQEKGLIAVTGLLAVVMVQDTSGGQTMQKRQAKAQAEA